jgi:hypothetical protein
VARPALTPGVRVDRDPGANGVRYALGARRRARSPKVAELQRGEWRLRTDPRHAIGPDGILTLVVSVESVAGAVPVLDRVAITE